MTSVLNQGYPNLEYIVMDGGSTDGTKEIIEKFGSRLTVWRSTPDRGQYDAIEQGFSLSTGEILAWLNADDMLLPRALFLVAEIFDELSDVEWISTLKPGWWDANGYFTGTGVTAGFSRAAFMDGLYLPGERSKGHWIQQESTFWRRSLWKRAGAEMPKDLTLAGDFGLWSEFFKHAELYGLEYPIAGFRTVNGQRSENKAAYLKEAKDALVRHRLHANYRGMRGRGVVYSKLTRIPKLGDMMRRSIGYQGKIIVNCNRREVGAGWSIENHRFLP